MLDFLFWVSAKSVVVTCAIIGALLVMLAPKVDFSFWPVARENNTGTKVKKNSGTEKILVMIGYSFVGLSVLLFIIAGFIVDLT